MPHWIVMLAAVLGACVALVVGAFLLGRAIGSLADRLRRLRRPRPG
jgi:hypothetical protein